MMKAITATTPMAAFLAFSGGGELSIGIGVPYPFTTVPPFGCSTCPDM
ncbi:hypothetical protein GGC47_004928 [Bosea sp. OAE752]